MATKDDSMEHSNDKTFENTETQESKQEDEQAKREKELKMKIEESRAERRALRAENLQAASKRPTVQFLKSLDSNIKRNTAFIKKIRQLSEDQKDSLCQELLQLNLSRYISEIVTAIVDSKMKTSDMSAAVKICSLLHQRYSDFSGLLLPALTRFFPSSKQLASSDQDQDKNSKLTKRRVILRLLSELLLVGVLTDGDLILRIVQDLVSTDQLLLKDGNRDPSFHNLSLIVSFVRSVGEEMLGLTAKKHAGLDIELKKEDKVLTSEQQRAFIELLGGYYETISQQLIEEHKQLRAKEKENHQIMETKGELSESDLSVYDKMKKSYEKILSSVNVLADYLNKELPELPEESNTTRIEAGVVSTENIFLNKENGLSVDSIFDDEDTRNFYENLPDLRAFIPGVLLGETEPNKEKEKQKEKEKEKENENEKENSPSTEKTNESHAATELDKEKLQKERQELEKQKAIELEKEERDLDKDSSIAPPGASSLDSLLQRLSNCVNRDLIRQAAIDFCYVNTKSNRKKLVKALFNVPRTSLALIPYYSLLVATLNQYMKDIGPMLVSMLEEEFNYLYQQKNQINIETKIRNIRFIGELSKFRICPSSLTLSCLKMCLDDFVHHNVDVACNLLETCGRFLFRSPETHIRTKNLLEKMMRLKNAQSLTNRLDTMVENAYYQCIPPEGRKKVKKEEPPMNLYVKKLIYNDLNKNTAKYVLKQLRKLPWKEYEDFVLKVFLKLHKAKYVNIHLLAGLASGLSVYHEMLGIKLVDSLLERIRVLREEHDFTKQQQQLMNIKFVGELYNYCLVESQIIFDTLYSLINTADPIATFADPPNDCFHIRLVCTLLDTCCQYFDRGSAKKKLDRFLLYFQRYIFTKQHIPMDVDFMISDCFESLRPHMVRCQSFEQVSEEIAKLEKDDVQQNVQVQKPVEEEGSEENEEEEEEEESEENEEEEDDDEDDDEDEVEDEEEEDEEVVLRDPLKTTSVEEDEEFDQEFNKLLQESLEQRKLEIKPGNRTQEMAIPMNLLRTSGTRSKNEDEEDEETPPDHVQFKVLMKKGNKQTTKSLSVPLSASLASNTMSKHKEEKEEHKELKRIVLEYEERGEEEIQNESLDGGLMETKNSNRGRGRLNQKTQKKQKGNQHLSFRRTTLWSKELVPLSHTFLNFLFSQELGGGEKKHTIPFLFVTSKCTECKRKAGSSLLVSILEEM